MLNRKIEVKVRNQAEEVFIEKMTTVANELVDLFNLPITNLCFARKAGWAGRRGSQAKHYRNKTTGIQEIWINLRETDISEDKVNWLKSYILSSSRWWAIKTKTIKLDYTESDLTLFALRNNRPYHTSKPRIKNKRFLATQRWAFEKCGEYEFALKAKLNEEEQTK